jgi:hypothetical protein
VAKRTGKRAQGGSRGNGTSAGGGTPPSDPRLAWIDRMRVYRGRSEPDLSIGAMAASLERATAQRQRVLGDVIDLWNEVAPERVRGYAAIEGLGQGTLTLTVTSSSASYELSRVLRDGLERTLVERMPARIKRVKVRVGADSE